MASWHRRALRTLAAALIAGGTFAAAHSANAATIAWTPGIGSVSYDATALNVGIDIDIDGDGIADIALQGSGLGSGYGESIALTPLTVNTINNEVFSDGSGIAVTAFSSPLEVLDAVFTSEPTVVAPGSAVLWDDTTPFSDFENPGAIAGVLFEIPGGSSYVGYIDLAIVLDFGFDSLYISESGYQLVPEPGTAMLVGAGGLLGLGLLGTRKARSKRES